MYMSATGDVEYNFTLVDFKEKGKEMVLETVGIFQATANQNASQRLVLVGNASVEWLNGGSTPVDVPACGFTGQLCISTKFELTTIEIVCIVLGSLLLVVFFAGGVIYRKQQLEKELEDEQWRVDFRDVIIRSRQMGSLRSQVSLVSTDSFDNINQRQIFTTVGIYKSNMVAIKRINKRQIELTREIKYEMKLMRTVRHENLVTFTGACVEPPNICILLQYCPKGSLQDILENEDIKLDSMFVNSLLTDIVKGMAYLHSTEIRSHGRLKSPNCVVDGRWVLKITDYGLNKFKSNQDISEEEGEYAMYYRKLWTAPELLRAADPRPRGTQKGDVYSFGIIVQELLTRSGPFDLSYYTNEPSDIIEKVTRVESPPFRPKLSTIVLEGPTVAGIVDLAKWCWEENPDHRPDFEEIRKTVRKLPMGKQSNIMDNMVNLLEKYANNLESLVEERTSQLADEKRKTENLLNRMLPPSVAKDLVHGKQVTAENFDEVSIFFSDIVGFTSLSSESTPLQVVDLLNDLYTLFDEIINNYDVYKVETIGDAYMVVSGLPIRNGHQHAGEIATMALHMLREIDSFKIRHRPNDKLKLRIGIHSGSCVAGVVGKKMPRYCLFGDTVNTASRMESNGEALKIHISPSTKRILDELGGYHIQKRGKVFLKGKGTWITYWLVGSDLAQRSHWRLVKKMLPKLSKPDIYSSVKLL
ncbi:atrial natriuretic peptide receptor 1 isoform X2 [Nematostella vectensis]|nr:atrial natriuretic peptide receptor 1 isoform X2 [Nematostella vectensis]XP_048576338.1 atrial natriuretic peptide receptor 1 isoform X2 [Nematostella vectensis]